MLNPENIEILQTKTQLETDEVIKLLITEVDRLAECLRISMEDNLSTVRATRDAYSQYVNFRTSIEEYRSEQQNKDVDQRPETT
jgi:hypothetical protein